MRLILLTLAVCLLNANASAASDPAQTRKFIAILQSEAGLFDKARACQQLGEIGDKEAVPALAALLGDDHLAAYARSGLEGIPDPSAAEALRAATRTVKGKQLVGVINSLGVLRDAKAVALLTSLAENSDSNVAKEALAALGRVSNEEAIRFLRKTLAKGAEARRPDAAAACLLAAQMQLAEGHADAALPLYEAVRKAKVASPLRAAATRGSILARKSDGPAFLIKQLRSNDRIIRNVALLTIRAIPSDTLAVALNAELKRADPELQSQLLMALVDCHNPQSILAVKAKTESDDPGVRKTALKVLGQIGGPADAGVFLNAMMNNRGADETGIALNILDQMPGTEVDTQILQALSSAKDSATRVKLIRLTGTRRMANATDELFKQATDSDAKVQVAAIEVLAAVAAPVELPALITFTKTCPDDAVRKTAENAIVSLCLKSGAPQASVETVFAELQRTTDPALRRCWVAVLASLGNPKALPFLKADLENPSDDVAAKAIAQLGLWPDPAPVEDLLALAESGVNPSRRESALQAAVRLATDAADQHQRRDDVIVAWLRRADEAAQSVEDRRMICSGLGRLSTAESFHLLARHLDDAGLENEAAIAIVQIAPALAEQGDTVETRDALEKIADTIKNEDIRQEARKAAAAIHKPSNK